MSVASFRARVLAAVGRIPPGRVATYGDVAELAGRPRAWRAVGNIMRDRALGGYGGSVQLKRELLRAEGIDVGATRIRHFPAIRWTKTATPGRSA